MVVAIWLARDRRIVIRFFILVTEKQYLYNSTNQRFNQKKKEIIYLPQIYPIDIKVNKKPRLYLGYLFNGADDGNCLLRSNI